MIKTLRKDTLSNSFRLNNTAEIQVLLFLFYLISKKCVKSLI